MIYVKNVSVWEWAVRLGAGGAVAIYGLTEISGLWGVGMLGGWGSR